jgi:ubiquinone/menaquinone biosynthesis C-methylase UbiE
MTTETTIATRITDEQAFDHGAISAFNAWFFSAFEGYINHVTRRHKDSAFAGLDGSTILEIGAGTGANLGYIPEGAHLFALEPNLRMHRRLRRSAARAEVEMTILGTTAEAIPLQDDSVDEVIASLVLCTVSDPEAVLTEIRRVLKPGGRFRFVEHVAAPTGSSRLAIQRLLRRPWAWLFEGCRSDAATCAVLDISDFDRVDVTDLQLRNSLFYPVNTAVWGVAS